MILACSKDAAPCVRLKNDGAEDDEVIFTCPYFHLLATP